jgi:cytochrome c-type biogenesis protein CcmH
MQADWVFFAIAGVLALAVTGVMFAPLIAGRSGGARRASYDMQVYRDQLREIDADAARGVLTQAEAEATRVEISRRLLAAADAEASEAPSGTAPRAVNRAAAIALGLAVVAGTAGLYAAIGGPGQPDQPLVARLEAMSTARATRPSQAAVEAIVAETGTAGAAPGASEEDRALVERLETLLEGRPDDLQGHRLLARSEAALGRWARARAAQERVVAILADDATAQDRVDLAEFMILATSGYVSPEAEAMIGAALEAAPGHPVARYYSGLALLQGGRPDLTLDLWSRLLAEGPQDAPWIIQILSQIDEVAAAAGRPAPPVPPQEPATAAGPGGDLGPPDEAAMIEGMVEGLAARLASEGGPPEDWARLIRSLGVLGRTAEAGAIWAEAQDVFATDAEAMEMLRATASDAGLVQ